MRHRASLSLAVVVAAALAACGGGGSGGQTGLTPIAVATSGSAPNSARVSMTIKLPSAASAVPNATHPQYISAATQSIGIVVTNQGLSPSAAQYTNVSSCPSVNGVSTCSVVVQANPGTDVFAISTYSGTNGSGSVLSTGSITSTIVAGTANTTLAVTLGGVVASISITPGVTTLPLGESTSVNVVAKDASGAAIVGPYDNPIVLSGSNLVFSKTSVTNSNDASNVTVAWGYGYSSSTSSTVTASADGKTASLAITPGTGIAFYQTGMNSVTDVAGFKMIAGPDGKLYYTTLGAFVCQNNFCSSSSGSVHRFDPATFTDTEVALQSEGIGLKFSSDGALWIAGGPQPQPGVGPYIYRMAPSQFSSSALTAIAVPTPTPNPNGSRPNSIIRAFAEDGSGNLWFTNAGGARISKIPIAGPYTSAQITEYGLPSGPMYRVRGMGINYAGGVLSVLDANNGRIDVVDPSTGTVTGTYPTSLQQTLTNGVDSAQPFDSATDGTYQYVAEVGNWSAAEPVGDLERFDPVAHTFTTLPLVAGPVAAEPLAISLNGPNLYFQELFNGALDYLNLSTNHARSIPLAVLDGSYFNAPNGVAALADGSAWFTCSANAQVFSPLCIGHTVYFSRWSIFPSNSITLYGAGSQSAQLMGIMEAPSSDNAPFTVTSGNTSVCTIANASDHNFTIVGQAPGACIVTVKDKNAVTSSINVTVTTTTGTVQAKHVGGIK